MSEGDETALLISRLLEHLAACGSAENEKSARAGAMVQPPKARLESALFFDKTDRDLRRLNIIETGFLQLKRGGALGGWVQRAEAIRRDDVRSSTILYDRLEHLQTLASQSGMATHAWTEAFLSRAYGIVLPSQTTAFGMERSVLLPTIEPSIPTTLRGIIGHVAPIADGSVEDTRAFFSGLTIEQVRSTILSGIVVAETELPSVVLENNVPRLAIEMYGYAKALARNVVRGTLTTGDVWIFVILVMDPDGGGAKYWQSEEIGVFTRQFIEDPVITPPVPDAIAGLLAHWLNHSFEGVENDDDWFEARPIPRY